MNDEIPLKQGGSSNDSALSGRIWKEAEPKLAAEFAPLLRDLARWSGVVPEYRLSGGCYSAMRNGKNQRLLALFNPGTQTETPVLNIPAAEAPAVLTAVTLEGETELGTFSAEQLRNGVRLPEVPAGRFLGVSFTR